MTDPRFFPDRPDHPDFWLMSQVLVDGDTVRDNDTVPFEDHLAQVVDPKSLGYMAVNQAALFISRSEALSGQVISRNRVEVALAAAWMTAFQYGVRFAALRNQKDLEDSEVFFTSVNEDGEVYDRHATLADALARLREYPNDTVVITLGAPYTSPEDA